MWPFHGPHLIYTTARVMAPHRRPGISGCSSGKLYENPISFFPNLCAGGKIIFQATSTGSSPQVRNCSGHLPWTSSRDSYGHYTRLCPFDRRESRGPKVEGAQQRSLAGGRGWGWGWWWFAEPWTEAPESLSWTLLTREPNGHLGAPVNYKLALAMGMHHLPLQG